MMNNSVFGKPIKNIRNRVDIRILNDVKKAENFAAKPNYKHSTIFDENSISIHMKRTKLKFNKVFNLLKQADLLWNCQFLT